MKYDFAIEHLEKLERFLENSLKEWENSEFKDNEIAKEMIRTYKELIKEVEEEIKVYINAKETGYIMTREGRQMLKELGKNEQSEENER